MKFDGIFGGGNMDESITKSSAKSSEKYLRLILRLNRAIIDLQ